MAKSLKMHDGFNIVPMDYGTMMSPVGKLHLFATSKELIRIDFRPPPKSVKRQSSAVTKNPILKKTVRQLNEYFSGNRTEFDLPLLQVGTPFQIRVWRELSRIPFGSTISYGEQAQRVGVRKAYRAVGSANGRNPFPIVVPCHRVIAGNGQLGGYSGGLGVKSKLLSIEQKHTAALI